eukprot:gene22007-28098_t
MFKLIDSKSGTGINFGEFMEVTCTFACFEQTELLRFFFYLLDVNKSGLVEKNEVKHFLSTIWNDQISSNLQQSFDYIESMDDGDGMYNFNEIMSLHKKYPNTFYPIFRLQIHERIDQEMADIQRKQQAIEYSQERIDDDIVRKRMGKFKFYFMPWLRVKERAWVARIAALESQITILKSY